MNNLDDSGLDLNRFRLGSLCKNRHEWSNSGQSLRYRVGGHCIQCAKQKASQSNRTIEAKRKLGKEALASGRGGSDVHKRLIDLVRCKTLAALESKGWKGVSCLTTTLMSSLLPQKLADSRLSADAIFVHSNANNIVLIEVGQYVPSKWDSSISVIHVGFNHRVSKVNFQGRKFENALFEVVSDIVQQGRISRQHYLTCTPAIPDLDLVSSRSIAISALVRSGLSPMEIMQVQISDYNPALQQLTLKTSTEGVLWLTQDTVKALNDWLYYRGTAAGGLITRLRKNGPARRFCLEEGIPSITHKTIGDIVREYAGSLGLPRAKNL